MTEPVEPTHPPANEDSDPGTEAKLLRLYELSEAEKKIKTEREALRDEILQDFDGSRYFLGPDGKKYYGYRVAPEPIEIDVNKLAGYISTELLDEVTERKVLKDKFAQAVKRTNNGIPMEVFVKVARKKPQKPHIRFGDPSAPPANFAG